MKTSSIQAHTHTHWWIQSDTHSNTNTLSLWSRARVHSTCDSEPLQTRSREDLDRTPDKSIKSICTPAGPRARLPDRFISRSRASSFCFCLSVPVCVTSPVPFGPHSKQRPSQADRGNYSCRRLVDIPAGALFSNSHTNVSVLLKLMLMYPYCRY